MGELAAWLSNERCQNMPWVDGLWNILLSILCKLTPNFHMAQGLLCFFCSRVTRHFVETQSFFGRLHDLV